jgi:hypothetical protein
MPRHLIVAVLPGWAGRGAVADGGGVTDPEQAGELERVTVAGLGLAEEPVGAQILRGDADGLLTTTAI